MIDYEVLKAEGAKFGIADITPEEFERNRNFTSLVTILTRIKNERGDVAKRVKKQAQIEKERKQQPEPEILSMPVRSGLEPCALHGRVKRHCEKQGFTCNEQCWARIAGSVLCVEGITVEVGVTRTKRNRPPKSGLFEW